MKLNFLVNESVLIPQPDTEILVEEVINLSKNNKEKIEILDMCTGSGCIAISLAKYIENSNLTGVDISLKALEVARKNAEINNIKNINWIESNLFEKIENKYDFIVSNPPYIKTEIINTLSEEVKKEPMLALDGGLDGLDFYKQIIKSSKNYLKKNGYLCLEIGYDQKKDVINLLEKFDYKNIYCKKDLGENDRVIIAKNM